MRQKNVSQNNQMQEFIRKLTGLKNENDYNLFGKIMSKKNVSQDHQLQEFIPKIIELTNDSESNKI